MFKLSIQCYAPKFLVAFFSLVLISFSADRAAAQFGPTPTFAPPVSYSIPEESTGFDSLGVNQIKTGDLNNDGKLDIAYRSSFFGNSANERIYIYLNDGSGGFGQPIIYQIIGSGPLAYSLGLADFNRDGNLDIVYGLNGAIAVSHGDGTGHFGPRTEAAFNPAGCYDEYMLTLVVGDVNHDNNPDVYINTDGPCGGLSLGNGNTIENSFAIGQNASRDVDSIAIADFNNDGNPDLFDRSDQFDRRNIYFGDGSGGFTHFEIDQGLGCPSPNLGNVMIYETFGDFNGDGKVDVASPFGGVQLGDGTGHFSPCSFYPFGTTDESGIPAWDIKNADINSDGNLDLITIGADKISVLLGNGSGGFGSLTAIPGDGSFQGQRMAIADFNSDGRPDIAELGGDPGQHAGQGHNPRITIFLNTTPYQTPVGQNSTVTLPEADFTFDEVTAGGTTTVTPIDPATAGDVPGGFALADIAFEVNTTATFTGEVTSCFTVSSVNVEADFLAVRVLHSEGGSLVDRTSSYDFPNRKICATTTSFSPFYLATVGKKVLSLFDRSRAFKSGSTVPVKVKILNESDQNLSAATLSLSVRGLRRIGAATASIVNDAGNSNPDYMFRYDSSLQGYIYNLKTTGLAAGKYVLSFYAGSDSTFLYTLTFDVR